MLPGGRLLGWTGERSRGRCRGGGAETTRGRQGRAQRRANARGPQWLARVAGGTGAMVGAVVGAALLGGCPPDKPAETQPQSLEPARMTLTSPEFGAGQAIPERYSADGGNTPPPLQWGEPPRDTREQAVVMEDEDAPTPDGKFVHWVVFNIPPSERKLPPAAAVVRFREGANSAGRFGYFGPQPPPGRIHTYTFTVYAVNKPLDLNPGSTRGELMEAMKDHVIGIGKLTGVYRRPG